LANLLKNMEINYSWFMEWEALRKNGVYDRVVKSLNNANINFVEYSGVKSNPALVHTYKGIEIAKKEKPDLILLDIVMPKMGGLEVMEEMQKNPDLKKNPRHNCF